MNQQDITQLIKAMKAVLQQETDVLALLREENMVSASLVQQRRVGAMHDGFASVISELATDAGAESMALHMLGGYPL